MRLDHDLDEVASKWFGPIVYGSPVIISPIQGIVDLLLRGERGHLNKRGWYTKGDVVFRNCKTPVILAPMGKAIEDLAKVLGHRDTKVFFVGFCGGLMEDLCVGDIVQENNNPLIISNVRKVHNTTVDGMLIEYVPDVTDTVEMECDYLRNYVHFVFVLFIVSDLPGKRSFHSLTTPELQRLKEANKKAIKTLIEALSRYLKEQPQ